MNQLCDEISFQSKHFLQNLRTAVSEQYKTLEPTVKNTKNFNTDPYQINKPKKIGRKSDKYFKFSHKMRLMYHGMN